MDYNAKSKTERHRVMDFLLSNGVYFSTIPTDNTIKITFAAPCLIGKTTLIGCINNAKQKIIAIDEKNRPQSIDLTRELCDRLGLAVFDEITKL